MQRRRLPLGPGPRRARSRYQRPTDSGEAVEARWWAGRAPRRRRGGGRRRRRGLLPGRGAQHLAHAVGDAARGPAAALERPADGHVRAHGLLHVGRRGGAGAGSPGALAGLVLDGLRAQAAQPPAPEIGPHAADVVARALLLQAAALAADRLHLHGHDVSGEAGSCLREVRSITDESKDRQEILESIVR